MQPNILWITTDQHNARCLGSAGNPDVHTPALDRLAQRGTRFSRAYCTNPICQPSRISLITGQRPHHHGAYGNSFDTPDDLIPLTQLLRQAGYQTALVGKGHFGWSFIHREFDRFWLDDPGDVPDFEPLECDYLRFMIERGVADRGFCAGDVPLEAGNEWWVAERAIEFLQQRDTNSPFFAWVSFQRPHAPHTPPEPYKSLYDPDRLHLPPNTQARMEDRGATVQRRARGNSMPEKELRWALSQYYGLITLIDSQIERILAELEAQGLADSTAIFFTSDHGDFAAEFGMMYKEVGIYEPVHRVPMIACCPGISEAGWTSDTMVETIDFYPTACRVAGIPVPAGVDGESLLPPAGPDSGGESGVDHGGGAPRRRNWSTCEHGAVNALRTERFRLFEDERDGGELYDHEVDPWETRNVYDDPAYLQTREELTEQLHAILADGARVVTTWRHGWGPWGDDDVPTRHLWKGMPWSEVKARFQIGIPDSR